MNHPEFELQKRVCTYLNWKYPNVLYMSDTVASLKLTKRQAKRNKSIQKDKFKTPDVIIFEPNELYHGLFVELKVNSPYQKRHPTKLYKSEHLEGQQKTINDLIRKGYYATFATGYEQTIDIIEKYLKNIL